ncbi:FxsA family protein [Sporosarcina siberiensis]|uniref:FxsA family protein n=1 Tax=Sporosarcina siberiensis TaxID=1365606 RepID=A0ABW4SDZ2_9BACL
MRWLILLFVLVPTAELAILIYSGNTIGILPTLIIILITGIGGAYLARKQGLKAWSEIRLRMSTMETPGDALIDGVCIFIGGLFLLIPGFLTDIFGFLLLFSGPRNMIRPFIHKWIYKKMKNNQILMM